MTTQNLFWHEGEINRSNRHQLLGQQGATIWFTGLSGCGKSTIAVELEKVLFSMGKLSYRLDGDNIRLGINSDLSFSQNDRTENIRRVGEVAKLIADTGVIVLCSFISPYKIDRDRIRQIHLKDNLPFYEVYIDCPLEIAELRDPKGLYQKARAGIIPNFTGISDPYEIPESPDIHIQTNEITLNEEVNIIIQKLKEDGILDIR